MKPVLQFADPTLFDNQGLDAVAGLTGVFAAFFMVFLVIAIVTYIYMAITVMKTAQRLKVEPAWLAWVPIANLYLILKMGKQPWWPMLLLLGMIVPVLGILFAIGFMVFMVMAEWKICEARKKEGWWAIITVVPIVGPIWNFVMWGILAWGK